MSPVPDSLKAILDHKYRGIKFDRIEIPYLKNFIDGSQLSAQHASAIRSSLINDQYLDLSSVTRFNNYQELIDNIDNYLNEITINNLNINNIYASQIQGLIQQSQIDDFNLNVYASQIQGLIQQSQIDDFNLNVYASQIQGLIQQSQIDDFNLNVYASEIIGLIKQSQIEEDSDLVYASEIIGKLTSSQISSITASLITPYIKSTQIEAIDLELTPQGLGYCLNSNPCTSASGDVQPLVGSLDVVGALEAFVSCNMWAYGYSGISATNQLSTHPYHYHISTSSRTFTAKPAELESSCFAYLIGASPVMAYDNDV